MKEENKKCWNCGAFRRFYTKGYCNLQQEDIGFCSTQNKIVDKKENCKKWNYRQRVRNMRKQTAISSIADIRTKIDVIEKILTEESESDKIKNEN